MFQFFRIILLNAWRGMRRANVLPALVLMFASIGVLLVGSNAAASGSVHDAAHVVTRAADHVRQMTLGSVSDNNENAPVPNATRPKAKHNAVSKQVMAAQLNAQQPNISSETQQNPGISSQTSTVQLSAGQPACLQGQNTYTVASALFTLPTQTTVDGTLTYYWETRIDSGTNSSGTSPISSTQTSQDLPAGSSQVTLNSSQSSQPFVSAPASTSYAYSFRLHVLAGSTDTTSAWVSVPQETSTTCSQN